MSTSRRQTPATAKTTASTAPPATKGGNPTPWIVGAVVAVIAVIGLGVVLLSGGDDDEPAGGSDASSVPVDVEQYQPVTVTGTPLAPLDPTLPTDPAVGTTAPVVDGASFDGTPVTIGPDGAGHTMVVVVAHWCPHCNAEIPRLIELQEEGRLPADLRIVAVSTSVDSGAPNYPPSSWLADKGWPWEALADSEQQDAAIAYGTSGFPFVTVYDSSGVVTARWSGESSTDELAERIDAAVGA